MSSTVLSINSNIASLKAQRRLDDTASTLSSTYEKLSSGLRINRASDDAAGLAISSSLKASTRIYSQAVRNLSDGFSLLAIAEGALGELSSITTRQIELAEQAANGVYSLSQRRAINTEANALANEYNRIIQSTEFNGRNILDVQQNEGVLTLQCGYGTDGTLQIHAGDEASRTVGDGTFQEAVTYSMPNSCQGLAVGDLDHDGFLDMVTVDAGPAVSNLNIRFGNGDGTFGSRVSQQQTPPRMMDVALADLNGDGNLDIIMCGEETAGTVGHVAIRLGNGDGTFGVSVSYATECGSATGIASGDLNNDGILDLTVSCDNGAQGYSAVFIGSGNGSFGTATSYLAELTQTSDVSLADMNGDGNLDMITAGTGYTSIRLGNGDGTFGSLVSYAMQTAGTAAVAIADLNNDGYMDVVTTGDGGPTGSASVRLGNGDGTLGARVSYEAEPYLSEGITLQDVNGDGIPDLTTAGRDSTTEGWVTLRLGNGDGTFGSARSVWTDPTWSQGVYYGDLDGDGALDLIVGGYGRVAVCMANSTQVSTMPRLSLFTQSDARYTLDYLKGQLDRINSELGALGSFESRLGVASNVLQVSRENYLSANSRIEDVDIALESATLVRTQILQQAAASVLAQANQSPALALKLLAE